MKKYLVNTSVLDLRKEPVESRFFEVQGSKLATQIRKDLLQETQLLYNEQVIGLEVNYGWVFVEAIEQQKCGADGKWRGYLGWVRAEHLVEVKNFDAPNLCVCSNWSAIYSDPDQRSLIKSEVSLGTSLIGLEEIEGWLRIKTPKGTSGFIPSHDVRDFTQGNEKSWAQDMIEIGKNMLHAPYFWGGRSAYRPDWKYPFTSVDCSSLVQLLYRIFGLQLPRDAHDQFLRCYRRENDQMKIGDLVFLAEVKKPSRISHVMLYAANDLWLEAEMCAKSVRLVSTEEKLGVSLEDLTWGCRNDEYIIFFSSVFPENKECFLFSQISESVSTKNLSRIF